MATPTQPGPVPDTITPPRTSAAIAREPLAPATLDYRYLLDKAIAQAQTLAGDLWTDYNDHDPGVTILQQLCYAITDLAYRTEHPIEDLLAPPPGDGEDAARGALYTGDHALSCGPLTAYDYRKLILSEIHEVQNAWVVPLRCSGSQEVPPVDEPVPVMRGLYQVYVQTVADRSVDDHDVLRRVRGVLLEQRNLGEDFVALECVPRLDLVLDAEIDIDAEEVAEDIVARALFELQHNLAPPPQLREVDALLQAGNTPDEVYVGPRSDLGMIGDQQLGDLSPPLITVERIASILRNVDGVRGVHGLKVTAEDKCYSLPVNEEGEDDGGSSMQLLTKTGASFWVPRMVIGGTVDNTSQKTEIRVVRQGRPNADQGVYFAEIDAARVSASLEHLHARRKQTRRHAERRLRDNRYARIPWGSYRPELARYRSIQHLFPLVYGVGAYGLPEGERAARPSGAAGSRTQREAEVRQLKAYLLFFEQLLTNHLAQLANVARLYSLDEGESPSYYYEALGHQPPREDDPPAVAEVLVDDPEASSARLAAIVHAADPALDRREAILDHLLARFNERFDDGMRQQVHADDGDGADGERAKRIADKCDYLREYIALSGDRAAGINYAASPHLDEVRVLDKHGRTVLSTFGATSGDVLRQAADPRNYRRRVGERGMLLRDPTAPHRRLGQTSVEWQARDKLARFVAAIAADPALQERHVRSIRHRDGLPGRSIIERRVALLTGFDQNFYVVEHILLRPLGDPHPKADEFFSQRLSVFLPAPELISKDTDFRAAVERALRENCPAHLALRCHWLFPQAEMKAFERLYARFALARFEYEHSGDDRPIKMASNDSAAAELRLFITSREALPAERSEAG